MKKILHFCCICVSMCLTGKLLGQTRSELLDAQWKVVTVPESAKYSREVSLTLPDSAYSVTVKYVTGEIMMQGLYQDAALDIEHGDFKYWYANGNPESAGRFKDGYKVGTWKRWNFDGAPKPDRTYPDEAFNRGVSKTGPAKFPGGMGELQRLVSDSLAYPEEARNRGLEGTVYITFTIDATGEVRLPEVSDGVHYLLDEEALRFVSSLPTWTPAAKHGVPVESSYIMPITFDLGGSGPNGNSGKGSSSKN